MSERVLIWLLIEQEGTCLLAHRKADEPPFAGRWTLPGDEMRREESALETIQRIGRDDLGVELGSEEFIDTFYLEESGTRYAVTVFKPLAVSGPLRYRESGPYLEVAWGTAATLPEGTFSEIADVLEGRRHWRDDEPTAELADGDTTENSNAATDR